MSEFLNLLKINQERKWLFVYHQLWNPLLYENMHTNMRLLHFTTMGAIFSIQAFVDCWLRRVVASCLVGENGKMACQFKINH